MSGNSIGKSFVVTTFGESHGQAMGCVIDGCPPGIEIDESIIQIDLDRRKPGSNEYTTKRKEDDIVEILSGVFEGKTTGTPVVLLIKNKGNFMKIRLLLLKNTELETIVEEEDLQQEKPLCELQLAQ